MSDFRFYPAHISKAQLLLDAGSVWVNSPRQTDQPAIADWYEPANDSDTYQPYSDVVDALDYSRGVIGDGELRWTIMCPSPGMVEYVLQNAARFGGRQSTSCTIRTRDRASYTEKWKILNAVARLTRITELETFGRGYAVIIDFAGAVEAPEGPDLDISAAYPAFTLTQDAVITFTVSNIGDAATFANTVVIWQRTAQLTFVGATGSGWTIAYSTDGGTIYSPAPPVDPLDITHVRWTRAANISAGASAPNIAVTVYPHDRNNGNPISSTVTVSTTGDTDVSNNSDTQGTSIAGRAFTREFTTEFN